MLTNEAFARLVAEDVKNRVTDEQRKYLRLPENVERWQRNLVALLENLSDQFGQLAEREKDEGDRYRDLGEEGIGLLAEMQADVDQRRKRIARFRFHVENRLDEATRIIAAAEGGADADMLRFVQRAIEKHRELTEEAELDPTPIDKALWSSLQGHWEFDDIDLASI